VKTVYAPTMKPRFDEVSFHTLWASDLDPVTSAIASIDDDDDDLPASPSNRRYFDLGLIAGLVLYVAWQLW
jgi:hypothetical protein